MKQLSQTKGKKLFSPQKGIFFFEKRNEWPEILSFA